MALSQSILDETSPFFLQSGRIVGIFPYIKWEKASPPGRPTKPVNIVLIFILKTTLTIFVLKRQIDMIPFCPSVLIWCQMCHMMVGWWVVGQSHINCNNALVLPTYSFYFNINDSSQVKSSHSFSLLKNTWRVGQEYGERVFL